MMIEKAVILAAGLGTRLIPYSKEMPKEMLPIAVFEKEVLVLKPVLHLIFESLYDAGVREYCFIVGKGKRAIEDYFTPEWGFIELLCRKGRKIQANILKKFYEKLENSALTWINQPEPRGTGDAILRAKHFVGNEYFIAVAGDSLFLGENVVVKLMKLHKQLGEAFITVKKVKNPRGHGVVVGEKTGSSIYLVRKIIEKPRKPPSNLINTSLYILPPDIMNYIKVTKPSLRGEIEITNSLQMFIDSGHYIYAYETNAQRIDIGTPQSYVNAIFQVLTYYKNL